MEELGDDGALDSIDVLDRDTLGDQGVDECWEEVLLVCTEGSIGR